MNTDLILDRREAAAYVKHSYGHLANLASRKQGPRYFKRKGKILYRLSDLEAYFLGVPVLTIDSMEKGNG